ncbi:FadR/GntR family transcriptional regulator [Nocardia sp. NPDC055049]
MNASDRAAPRTSAARGSLVERVTSELMQMITTQLGPGDRIPSVEALASRYGVSRTVVRESAARLSARGVLEIRHGDGTYVAEPDASAASTLFADLIRMTRHDVRSVFIDVMEFRAAIEPEAARLAAMRATPEDIARMMDIHARGGHAAATDDRDALAATDVELHDIIYEASHNLIIQQLMTVMRPLLNEQRTRYPYLHSLTDRKDHDDIVHAILGRDPQAAETAARSHVAHLRSHLTAAMYGQSSYPRADPGESSPD